MIKKYAGNIVQKKRDISYLIHPPRSEKGKQEQQTSMLGTQCMELLKLFEPYPLFIVSAFISFGISMTQVNTPRYFYGSFLPGAFCSFLQYSSGSVRTRLASS
jgi:hypothetical protein